MAETVENTESTRFSQALPTQSSDSLALKTGDHTSVDPASGLECSAAHLKDKAKDAQQVPTNTPSNLDFDTCYARFLDQSARSTSEGPREHRVCTSLRSPVPIDPAAAVHDFHTHYERFVGYSVDPQWFNGSAADPYRSVPKRRSSGLNLVLRNGALAIGSLIATGILGTLLLKAGSEGPQYSYREYSPDLFEQSDFTVKTPSPSDSTVEAYSAPEASELEPTRKVELQSFVPDTTTPNVLRVPHYQVVMPDWTAQINEFAPQTLGVVNDVSPAASSSWDVPEVESALTVLPVDTPTLSEIVPSVGTSEPLDTSLQVEPSPVIPAPLSATDVVIYNEIAFQSLTDAVPEASQEAMVRSLKVFDGGAAKQAGDSTAIEPSGGALESEN